MKGNIKAPIWIIPVLVLVMAVGAFAAYTSISHFTAQADVSPTANIPISSNLIGLGAEDVDFTIGPFETSVALPADSTLTFVFPTGWTGTRGKTNVTGSGTTVNGTPVTAPPTLDGTQTVVVRVPADISAGTDITVVVVGFGTPITPVTDVSLKLVSVTHSVGGATTGSTGPIPQSTLSGAAALATVPDPAFSPTNGLSSPNTAGALAEQQFRFRVSSAVPANTGEIRITWDKDVGVPTFISRNSVFIQASILTGCSVPDGDFVPVGQSATGCILGANQAVPIAFDATFDTLQSDPRRLITIFKVGDMNLGDDGDSGGVGVQGIAAGADVLLTLSTGAGIRNEAEVNTSGNTIEARATTGGVNVISSGVRASVKAVNKLFANDIDKARGGVLTINGVGYVDGKSATLWLDNGVDLNADGNFTNILTVAADETVLGRVVNGVAGGVDLNNDGDTDDAVLAIGVEVADLYTVIAGDDFVGQTEAEAGVDVDGDLAIKSTVTIMVDDQFTELYPRRNGIRNQGERDLVTFVVDDDKTFTQDITISNPPFSPQVAIVPGRFNVINAIGGEGERVTAGVNDVTFELEPSVRISPEEANIGDRVTISLFDYPQGIIDTMDIGGLDVVPTPGPGAIETNGEKSFTFTVPSLSNDGERIPKGIQRFDIEVGGVGNDADIIIGTATLTISHDTVIANQDLTISGSGFTEGTAVVCINQGDITLSNELLEIDTDSLDNRCDIGTDTGVEVTSGGTFTLTVRVRPPGVAAIPSSLLTAGTHELKIIDSSNAEGILNITILERTLEITPAAARPRDIVTIIGRNYPGDNPDTGSVSVEVRYECSAAIFRTVTADPDASGNFLETLRIPTNCAIPSTNTLKATIGGPTGTTVDTVTHEIPEGLVRIEPGRGPSGERVTVTGEGFRTFETVASVEFGGRETLGGRTVNTDAHGNFSVDDVLVPGLDPGIHAVIVEVGSSNANRTTASTSFEVLEAGIIGVPTPAADVYAMSDSLLRMFRFDNTTKVWAFNDRRPEFGDANTLDEVVSGGVYWILIDQDVDLDVDGILITLTCTGDDCWNLIVWP